MILTGLLKAIIKWTNLSFFCVWNLKWESSYLHIDKVQHLVVETWQV